MQPTATVASSDTQERILFVDKIPPTLVCPLHLGVLNDPVLAICGHTFCRSCIGKWLTDQPSCPFDTTPLTNNTLYPNRALAQQCDELLVYCKYGVKCSGGNFVVSDPAGCPAKVKKCERQRHEENCPYKPKEPPATCTFAPYGCLWQGSPAELEAHLSSCEFERMKNSLDGRDKACGSSQDVQIANLERLLQVQSKLAAELTRIYRATTAFLDSSKDKLAVGIATLMNEIEAGWNQLATDEKVRNITSGLDHAISSARQNVTTVVGNVRTSVSSWEKQISEQYSDLNVLDKLLELSSTIKKQISVIFTELNKAVHQEPTPGAPEEDREMNVAIRNSLQTYLEELRQKNNNYEEEAQTLIESILSRNTQPEVGVVPDAPQAPQPPAPVASPPPPPPPPAPCSAAPPLSVQLAPVRPDGEIEMEDFTKIDKN